MLGFERAQKPLRVLTLLGWMVLATQMTERRYLWTSSTDAMEVVMVRALARIEIASVTDKDCLVAFAWVLDTAAYLGQRRERKTGGLQRNHLSFERNCRIEAVERFGMNLAGSFELGAFH
jgi:hypothetical protein